MVNPCCPKCGGANITWQTKTFGGFTGFLMYCGDCGVAISWAPRPKT
jgi:hypothetical protein